MGVRQGTKQGREGRLRVTRTDAQELNTSSLHTAGVTSRALRVELVAVLLGVLAIVTRVTVDDGGNHAELLGTLNLEASEDAAILGNGNLALELDTSLDEIFEVTVGSVVDIDKGSGDVAAGRVAMESRDPVLEGCSGVILQHIFRQRGVKSDLPTRGLVARALEKGEAMVNGVVGVDVICSYAGLDTPRLPLLPRPLSLVRSSVSPVCLE